MTSYAARDALCELVNIGSGNAMTSLTRLIGRGRIALGVPTCVGGSQTATLDGLDVEGMAVRMGVDGVIGCTFLAVFDLRSALRLSGLLLEREEVPPKIEVNEESAILEGVNIFSCSFLGALSTMLRGVLIPSPPFASYGRLADLIAAQIETPEETIALSSAFSDATAGYAGRILLLAETAAVATMLRVIGVDTEACV